MTNLNQYIIANEDPAIQKLRRIIGKIRRHEILDIDELLLCYEYFPELYREYMRRWFKR